MNLRNILSNIVLIISKAFKCSEGSHCRNNSSVQLMDVDIIMAVYNAPKYVEDTLVSIYKAKTDFNINLIIVDDHSDVETIEVIKKYQSSGKIDLKIHTNKENKGYTKSVNIGLKLSQSQYVFVINSDIIVTDYWIDRMVKCLKSSPKVGLVGPFSNAATYQSVPVVRSKGEWAINELPFGIAPNDMNDIACHSFKGNYPEVPVLNGFCHLIHRKVIEKIGILDEVNFPVGYGEEVDYCLRALKAGFRIFIACNVYVYHSKTKSFTTLAKKENSKKGMVNLNKKHGKKRLSKAIKRLESNILLEDSRKNFNTVMRAKM